VAEAHEQKYERLLKGQAALRELATTSKRNTESAAADLEGATRQDAGDEKQRQREEAQLRHELEQRAREAKPEVLMRKRQTEEKRDRVALRYRCTAGACASPRGGMR
jgi:hypothetical protein